MESTFAVDSSGFSTCRFDRWFDTKWGKEKSHRQWLKAHIVTGTQTNIITSVEVTPNNTADSPMMPGLLDNTAERFTMAEVSADKAYLSDANLRHIERHGAAPFIPFKSNTTGQGSPMWKRLYAYFTLNEESWKAHYHRRSNVETTFAMIKGKFGDSVRAKSETGQINEILLKVLCHNVCVLIQAMHQLDVTPNFEPVNLPHVARINLNLKCWLSLKSGVSATLGAKPPCSRVADRECHAELADRPHTAGDGQRAVMATRMGENATCIRSQ